MDAALVILYGSLLVLGVLLVLARWLGYRVLAEEPAQRAVGR